MSSAGISVLIPELLPIGRTSPAPCPTLVLVVPTKARSRPPETPTLNSVDWIKALCTIC